MVPWALVTLVAGTRVHPELLFGMLGPLLATAGTWIAAERTYRRNPQALTGVMLGGLLVKALFFAGYVAVMLRGLDLRPLPFVFGFTAFFIGLYGLEALFLKRLFR